MSKPIPRMASVDTLERLAIEGRRGRGWYADAGEQIHKAASLLDCPPWVLADYLSLFSPRVSVKRSIRYALRYVKSGGEFAPDVMVSVRAAVEYYEQTGEIRGPKTEPFARALLGDPSAIVLDIWLAKAFKLPQVAFNRKPVRARCKRRIRKVAERLGWTPAETQAAIWCATVRRHGRKPIGFRLVSASLWGDTLELAA